MCPGQDTRYWRPDDIFTVACGSCGAPIEFFKDDAARRCAKCGSRVRNPRLSMGCAQWCQHAKECLGYDPREAAGGDSAPPRSVAESIIDALKREFGAASRTVERSLAAYDRARSLVEKEAANPSAVFPAVLLLLADGPVAKRIMEEAGVERDACLEAWDLISAYHAGVSGIGAGLRVLRKAYAA
jgi:hypothetical protein